jgi:hypothetical protein
MKYVLPRQQRPSQYSKYGMGAILTLFSDLKVMWSNVPRGKKGAKKSFVVTSVKVIYQRSPGLSTQLCDVHKKRLIYCFFLEKTFETSLTVIVKASMTQ